jgi:hypothetical protein
MRVLDYDGEGLIEDSLIGYVGNVFNFDFGDRDK